MRALKQHLKHTDGRPAGSPSPLRGILREAVPFWLTSDKRNAAAGRRGRAVLSSAL